VSLLNAIPSQLFVVIVALLSGASMVGLTLFLSQTLFYILGAIFTGAVIFSLADSDAVKMLETYYRYKKYLKGLKPGHTEPEDYIMYYDKVVSKEIASQCEDRKKDISKLESKLKKIKSMICNVSVNQQQGFKLNEVKQKLEQDISIHQKTLRSLEKQQKELNQCVEAIKTQSEIGTLLLEDNREQDPEPQEDPVEAFHESLKIVRDASEELNMLNFLEPSPEEQCVQPTNLC